MAPPLEAADIVENTEKVLKGEFAPVSLDMLQFIDMTRVELTNFERRDVERLVNHRRMLNGAPPAGPTAVVVRNEASYGMARMFAIYAEVMDMRSETQFFVSLDREEAAEWLFAQSGETDLSPRQILAEVDRLFTE